MTNLLEDTEGGMAGWYRVNLEEELIKNPDITQQMIADMRDWLRSKSYLPQTISDVELIHHIQSCEYDVEAAQTALEIHYTVRSKAQFFYNRDPTSKEIQQTSQVYLMTLVDQVDDAGNHAVFSRLHDPDSSKYNYDSTMRDFTMIMDLMRLEHGTLPGLVAVLDLTGFTLSHLIKVPIGSLRHFMRFLQEGTPTKISSLHMINVKGSIIDKVMVILRPLLSEKINQVMFFHDGYETLSDHGIKLDKLPHEYGGTAGPIKQLSEETHKRLTYYKEFFKLEESQRIDDAKKPRSRIFGFF